MAEGRARDVLIRYGIPPTHWNATLIDADGNPFLTPDGFWDEYCAALEIDSRAWHLRPEDWDRTRKRQRRLIIGGVPVISFSPLEIIDDPMVFAGEVKAFLKTVGRRPMPPGWTIRSAV